MTNVNSPPRTRYDEGCLAAHALSLIGDRWALLVVRELIFAPKRFQMLRAGLPGVSASVLAGRLTQLQEAGVVAHDTRLGVYSLLDPGRGLLPVLEALCRWALTVPGHDPARFISPSALMISMGVTLRQELVPATVACAGFDFGDEAFEVEAGNMGLRTTAVLRPVTPFVLRGSGNAMAVAVYGIQPLERLIDHGTITAEGDIRAAQDFVDMFRLHAPSVAAT